MAPRIRDKSDVGSVVLPILHPKNVRLRRRFDHQCIFSSGYDRPLRFAGAVAYTSAKAGLQGLTLSVAADYAAEGIRANCLIVGTVWTPIVEHLGEDARERRRKAVPLQTEGTAWDVAYAAVYLASDEARWVTGVMLPIDGGLLAIRPWPR